MERPKDTVVLLTAGAVSLLITGLLFYTYRQGNGILPDPLWWVMSLMGILTMIGLFISITLWAAHFFEDFHKMLVSRWQIILTVVILIVVWLFIPGVTYIGLVVFFMFLSAIIARNWEDVRITPMIPAIVFFFASLLPFIVLGERPWVKMLEMLSGN